MKKFTIFFAIAMMAMACTSNPHAINSSKLQGRYDVDFSSILQDIDEDPFTQAFAAMLLSQLQLTMQFDGNKLIFDASETVRTFVNVLSDSEQMPVVVEYQIVSDSILLTSANGVDWEEAGVLRKLADSYDYLQWVTYEEDGEQVVLTLHKQLQQSNME